MTSQRPRQRDRVWDAVIGWILDGTFLQHRQVNRRWLRGSTGPLFGQAAAVAFAQAPWAPARSIRGPDREIKWGWRLKVL